jgi:hypothetical protein
LTRFSVMGSPPRTQKPLGRYSSPSEAGYSNLLESSFHGFLQKVKGCGKSR